MIAYQPQPQVLEAALERASHMPADSAVHVLGSYVLFLEQFLEQQKSDAEKVDLASALWAVIEPTLKRFNAVLPQPVKIEYPDHVVAGGVLPGEQCQVCLFEHGTDEDVRTSSRGELND